MRVLPAQRYIIQLARMQALGADYEITDGERLPLAVKDLGSCDLYPQSLQHNPNGRFVTVGGIHRDNRGVCHVKGVGYSPCSTTPTAAS